MRSKQSNTRMWTFGSIALGVAALALVFTAVFSSTDATATESGVDANPQPPAQTSETDAEADTAAADTVAVTITDGAIEVPQTVAAGSATFEVTNDGQEASGFAIGSDLSAPAEVARLESKLEAGQSETLTAELEPGTYMAYLPAEDGQNEEGQQEQEGQQKQVSAEFTVEPPSTSTQ